jgi:glycosyltransferase involved in cell wall biosynthesis
MAPRVSVVIPVRDDGAFLDEAVGSVLAQSLEDFEVLVVDDGSAEPATVRLLDGYERPKTRVLRRPAEGVARARNAGFAAAEGRYFLPLDADDRLAPRFLERTVEILEARPAVGIVESEAELFGEREGRWERPPVSMPEILLGNTILPCALFRAEEFRRTRGYNPNMAAGWEDFDLWLSLLELGLAVERVPEVLFHYRLRPGSRSHRMRPGDWRRCYARILLNHPGLYGRHPEVLPRYVLRLLFKSS